MQRLRRVGAGDVALLHRSVDRLGLTYFAVPWVKSLAWRTEFQLRWISRTVIGRPGERLALGVERQQVGLDRAGMSAGSAASSRPSTKGGSAITCWRVADLLSSSPVTVASTT